MSPTYPQKIWVSLLQNLLALYNITLIIALILHIFLDLLVNAHLSMKVGTVSVSSSYH